MKTQKELVGASTSLLILALLGREASYGYELVKRINAEAEGLFEWQEGTVYPVLHKLEKQGLIRAQWQETASGRRRKYYHLITRGREALAEQAEEWRGFSALVSRMTGPAHA